MKIKLNQNLKAPNGDSMVYEDTKKEIFLIDVIQDALLFPEKDEDGKKKYVKYELVKRILEAKDEVDLTIEEIADIKKLIGKIKAQWIMGQAWDMLENKTKT